MTVEASGAPVKWVGLICNDPLGFRDPVKTPPYRFSMEIPRGIEPGPCNCTADGFPEPGVEVNGQTITVDIERADSPIKLVVSPRSYPLHVGERGGLTVEGTFADGTTVSLTSSLLNRFVSDNPGVVSVSRVGGIEAIRPGSAKITVTNGKAMFEVQVRVAKANQQQTDSIHAGPRSSHHLSPQHDHGLADERLMSLGICRRMTGKSVHRGSRLVRTRGRCEDVLSPINF